MFRLSERCSCGSKFVAIDLPLADAKRLLREWRRSHECQPSDSAEFAGSTTGLVTERDTIGFIRNNFAEEE